MRDCSSAGAFQPAETAVALGHNGRPQGEVHAFRKALWKEHTLELPDAFLSPESVACASEMKRIGDKNWEDYASEEVLLAVNGGCHFVLNTGNLNIVAVN